MQTVFFYKSCFSFQDLTLQVPFYGMRCLENSECLGNCFEILEGLLISIDQ